MGYFMGYYTIWLAFVKEIVVPFWEFGKEADSPALLRKVKTRSLETEGSLRSYRAALGISATVQSDSFPELRLPLMKLKEVLTEKKCPLCEFGGAVTEREPQTLNAYVDCGRCGRYRISEEAIETLAGYKDRYLLSSVCRSWPERDIPLILTSNIEALAKQASRLGVADQMDALLNLMAQKTTILGNSSSFDPLDDYPLLTLRDRNEAEFLIDALAQRHFVRGGPKHATVSISGWERLEQVNKLGKHSNLAFVAMWFDPQIAFLYDEGIMPAIREAGHEPVRIDRHEHVNRIDDEIIGQIRRARFMVADFTGQRLGVYFEAGLMMGLGRNVIWMCRKDELSEQKLHFDVRQYNFISWETSEDAKTRLLHRIRAIEGEGPLIRRQ